MRNKVTCKMEDKLNWKQLKLKKMNTLTKLEMEEDIKIIKMIIDGNTKVYKCDNEKHVKLKKPTVGKNVKITIVEIKGNAKLQKMENNKKCH